MDIFNMYKDQELYINKVFNGKGKFIILDGIKTFIVEEGTGNNIIFLNGILAWSFTWRKVFKAMENKNHKYALDFKGTGFSEKSIDDYSIDFYTEQLFELAKYYKMEEFILVGNSLGGEIALNFTLQHANRVKGLVLIDTSGYQENKEITKMLVRLSDFKATEYILKLLNRKSIAKTIIKGALYDEALINKEIVEGYYMPLKEKGAVEAFITLVENLNCREFHYENIKSINKPTLIIWGRNDKWIPVDDAYRFNRDIRDSRVVILDRCGHAPQEEYPEKVAELIEQFVANLYKK